MKILVIYLLKHYFGTIKYLKNYSYSFSLLCIYVNIIVKHFILFTIYLFILIYDIDMGRLLIYLRKSKQCLANLQSFTGI